MKTKQITKERQPMRDYDVAMLDCKGEFESTYNDMDVLDEEKMAEIEDDE
jgi:hypothetical protein